MYFPPLSIYLMNGRPEFDVCHFKYNQLRKERLFGINENGRPVVAKHFIFSINSFSELIEVKRV